LGGDQSPSPQSGDIENILSIPLSLWIVGPTCRMDVSKVLWWSASDGVRNQYYSKGGSWYARKKYWRNWNKNEKKGQREKVWTAEGDAAAGSTLVCRP